MMKTITSSDVAQIYKRTLEDADNRIKDDAFEITYHLNVPVRDDIYDYITEE